MQAFFGVFVTLAFIGLAGYVVTVMSDKAPDRLARVFLALAAFFGAVPAVLYAIWTLKA
ncbi:hypothetical protein ACOZ38_20990 [Sphaerisporangium viridialbum]|uniref:hypothetical protein n=1 Tax=Sphaerisporangium viridialbum TaxID=46189 RepID=UPI003C77399D